MYYLVELRSPVSGKPYFTGKIKTKRQAEFLAAKHSERGEFIRICLANRAGLCTTVIS